jgi:hypothetical protein
VDGITGEEDQKRDEKAPICCDMHGRNCEPPSELCCRDCSEAAHDTFPIRHADGSVCSAPGAAQGGFERMLADPYEQFDQRGELLKSVSSTPADCAGGQASSRDHLTAVVLSVADENDQGGGVPSRPRGPAAALDLVPSAPLATRTTSRTCRHIHLTPYGYLLYAATIERPGFIEEIRAVERRAGREDAARDALIIRGDLDITTVVAALDRAGFDCPDDALGDASADLLQRLPVWQGSDGRYRPRIPKVDQPGVQPTEEQRAEDQERDEGQG